MRRTFFAAAASLLLASCAAAKPIVTAGDSLTEETWDKVKTGTWLIEHYSPYCGHCKAFAPKWHELVELREADAGLNDFHFAQVDCAANGDLCHKNGVKYYPSLFLYVDGEVYDEYSGKRNVEALSAYVDENLPGKVVWLDKDGKPEVKGASITTEQAQAEGSRVVEPLETAVAAAAGGLHVAAGEDDLPTAPLKDLLGDSTVSLSTPAANTTIETPSETAESRPAAAFVTQMRKQSMEEKRNVSGTSKSTGEVQVLRAEELAGLKANDARPAFVKFFAPWCGHCKALAPVWAELAESLAGHVDIYEMDCDEPENRNACRAEKVRAYPTLVFYQKGASVEYNGKRDLKTIKAFTLRAISTTTIRPIVNNYELQKAADGEDVIFLFLHTSETSKEDISLASSAAHTLLGGAPFYTSTSPDFFSQFALPHTPHILAFKDHSIVPTNILALPSSKLAAKARLDATRQWLNSAKLPFFTEISSATFNDIMPSTGSPPLVAVAIMSRTGLPGDAKWEEAQERARKLAKGWIAKRQATPGSHKSRDVIWTWIEGDKWAGWARSMYDVKRGAVDGPKLILSDPTTLTYWKTSLSGEPLGFDQEEVFSLIEDGILSRKVPGESSRTFMERLMQKVSDGPSTLFVTAADHPFATLALVGLSWLVMWYVLKWCMEPIAPEVSNAKKD